MAEDAEIFSQASTEWNNIKFYKNLLKKIEKSKSIEIISHEIEPASKQGDNFLSALFRANVTYNVNDEDDEKSITLIVKTNLQSTEADELASEFDIFKREVTVYNNIISECEKILRKIDDEVRFGPNVHLAAGNLIVMEDLALESFEIEDKKERLNLELSKKVIEKLAKFHASTAVLYEANPKIFALHMEPNLTEAETPYHEFYRNASASCLEVVKTIPELEAYVEKFEEYQENIIPRQINVFVRDGTQFNCLNHGDVWTNNLMFKKNEDGEVEELLFVSISTRVKFVLLILFFFQIDYQEGYYGSPAIDLNFFFYTSIQDDVLENHLDELIELYQSTLSDTLSALEYKSNIPTLQNIKTMIRKKFDHALISTFCVLPMYFNENPEEVGTMQFLMDTEEAVAARLTVFENPRYVEVLKHLLPRFADQNLI